MGVTTRPEGDRRLDPDELAALEEQRQFLRGSLDDLERERAAGDLDESDYSTLHVDYTRRAEAVERAIAEGKARFAAARRRRSLPRSMTVAAAVLAVAVLAGVFAARAMGRREGGDTITGGFGNGGEVPASMERCLGLEQRGEALLALKCYDEILADQPQHAEALAYRGWLVARAGLPLDALKYLDRAVKADGTFLDGRAFRAIVLARLCRPEDARAELDALAALNPPEQVQGLLEGVRSDVDAQLSGAQKCTPP